VDLGGKDTESSFLLGGVEAACGYEGLVWKKELEEDRGKLLEVGLGGREDKKEEGELGQAVGGPRALLAKEREVGALEAAQLVLRLTYGSV